MDWGRYLFSFEGRINRAKIWLFVLIAIVVYIVYFSLFAFIFGGSILAMIKGGPAGLIAGGATIGLTAIVSLLVYLLVFYMGLAVTAKRLHDRNKSAWWIIIFIVIPLILSWVGLANTLAMMSASNATLPPANPLMTVLRLVSLGLTLWGFVELYCLRGTAGPNRYGPDPLAGKA